MQNDLLAFYQQANHTRFQNQMQGHYESFFLRANHPTRPLAFWIRYALFSPKTLPEKSIGGKVWDKSSRTKFLAGRFRSN